MGVAGLNDGPDTGHLSEYGGRDDEDAAPREHDTAVLKKNLRQNFEKAKFETGKLRNHYPPPLCRYDYTFLNWKHSYRSQIVAENGT